MKNQQAKHIIGYVTIYVKGRKPELFFQYCAMNDVLVWDIEKTAVDVCKGTIYLHEFDKVKKLIGETTFELSFVKNPIGLQPWLKRLWRRKETWVTACLCVLLLFALSNIAWKVDISGVPEETERNIKETLKKEGLYEGAWTYNLPDLNTVQQHALQALPELMYIGIRENGTTYYIDAILKRENKKAETFPERDLVAGKDGEIQRIFVKKGISKVAVHDVVQKGDLLVSGIINDEESEKDEEKETKPKEQVAAEGKVYANTWYEMDVTSSLDLSQSSLTGGKHQQYHIDFFDFSLSVWGWQQPYSEYITEEKTHTLHLFNHVFPISARTQTFYEVKKEDFSQSKKQARETAIKHIEESLQRKSGKDAKILSYKVLHERQESGKVKINLYVSVLEDIVQARELH